jgi:hypothetical protein
MFEIRHDRHELDGLVKNFLAASAIGTPKRNMWDSRSSTVANGLKLTG